MNNLILFILFVVVALYFLMINIENPVQGDIQDENYVDKQNLIDKFPYPQISRVFKRLSKGDIVTPINDLSNILPKGETELNIKRDNNNLIFNQREYLPDYYRKDRLSENPDKTEEYREFNLDGDNETSWSDTNVSEHPKFYNSDIKSELTNIGSFFDENNQYSDKTSPNTQSLTTDSCYTNKNGEQFCQNNTRLQLIPPKLITDVKSCTLLNNIGDYKGKYNDINNKNEKTMNGGSFYNNVSGSNNSMNWWSNPIGIQSGECSV